MEDVPFEKIRLKQTKVIARQIMLYFCDFFRWYLPLFDKRRVYRIPFYYYDKFREKDKERFRVEMYRLIQAGFIKKYYDGKNFQIELSAKGKDKLKTYLTEEIEIQRPQKWDKKWRLVIYDIANDRKDRRDVLRNKLENLGFLKLQESVYVFPFDCFNEINLIKNMYYLTPHVQYIVAERIETEANLIKKFYDRGLLEKEML